MTNFESLVLGVVQGVTEFLPISSTAHLRIVPALLRWDDPGAAYTAVLQLGSLVAVIGYFLPELIKMLSAGAQVARRSVAAAVARGARARLPDRRDDPGRRRRGAVPARHRGVVPLALGDRQRDDRRGARAGGGREEGRARPRLRRAHPARRAHHRLRAGARADPGRVALGEHADGGDGARLPARGGRALLVPAQRPDRRRRRASSSCRR